MKILLLGDSILARINGRIDGEVVNKSRVGQYTWMIERDVETFNIKSFDNVFLMIGINDFLNRDYSAQKTSDCIIKTINAVQSQKPINMTVLGLLPVLDETLEESEYCNKNIPEINKLISNYCLGNNINFIDCYSKFLNKKGKIDKTLFKDGIHPTDKGYLVLTDIINSEIKKEIEKE